MHTLPISDTLALTIDHADPDTWHLHAVDFASRTTWTLVAHDHLRAGSWPTA